MNATTRPRGSRATRNACGTASHQAPHERDLRRGLVARGDREDRLAVAGAGALDRVVLDRGREERLAHERLLDEREHVGDRRPAGGAAAAGQLAADLPPRGRAVGPVAHRVGGAQQREHRLADGVVDHEPLAPELGERQRRQALERGLGRLARHDRAEQRERDAPQHRGGVQRLARGGVEPVEVERRELLHDGRQDRVLAGVRAGAHGRGRELQRQRVPAREAVDPGRLRLVEAGAPQDLAGVGGRERAERDDEQQLPERAAPGGAGRVARGEHDARPLRQRGQQLGAQPAVDQPQPLGRVDHEHDRAVRGRHAVADGGQEAVRGRLDRAPVDRDHGRAARGRLGPERAQQRGLARAGDPVHDGRERPAGLEHAEQRRELRVAAGERRAPLGQQRSERPRHGQVAAAGSGSGATTIVATTGLIASVGSIVASPWRRRASGPEAS